MAVKVQSGGLDLQSARGRESSAQVPKLERSTLGSERSSTMERRVYVNLSFDGNP